MTQRTIDTKQPKQDIQTMELCADCGYRIVVRPESRDFWNAQTIAAARAVLHPECPKRKAKKN